MTIKETHLSILSVRYTSCASSSVCVMARDTMGVVWASRRSTFMPDTSDMRRKR